MRCRDVRRRLNEAGDLDTEIIKHLESCNSCAREAEAAGLLASSLNTIRNEGVTETTPFAELRSALEERISREDRKEQSIMRFVKKEISSHPRFSFGLAAAVCLFAFLLLVPISYDKTVGYNLVMSEISPDNGIDPVTVDDVINAMGYADVQISTSLNDKKLKIIFENLPSKKAVQEITSAVASLAQAEVMTEVTPIVVKEMGTIYAQVRDKLTVKVDTEGKSDQEIEEEIEKDLKQKGYPNPNVEVKTKPDGKREIRIDTKLERKDGTGAAQKREQQMVIMSEGDSLIFDTAPLTRIEIGSKGKTDAEIEREIRDKLRAKGMENPEITITTQPDGKREIKIDVKKEEKIDH